MRDLSAPRRVLILAPHPDDEIVASGIVAARARADGASVAVFYLTTGVPPKEALWSWQQRRYADRVARRREEAARAAALLGLDQVGQLDIPSRRLTHHLDRATAVIGDAIATTVATELWVPAFEGAHQDHDAANAVAAGFRERLPVWEFAAYNFAGGRVSSNRFWDARGGVIEAHSTPEEIVLKRRALALYASERGNLRHIAMREEAYRPLPQYDYGTAPHPGPLFRERFQWVPFRHPRIDFAHSAEIYEILGRWRRSAAPPIDTRRAAVGDVALLS
jgi:N-acetylglucosamine malate deacetylase 1